MRVRPGRQHLQRGGAIAQSYAGGDEFYHDGAISLHRPDRTGRLRRPVLRQRPAGRRPESTADGVPARRATAYVRPALRSLSTEHIHAHWLLVDGTHGYWTLRRHLSSTAG